jgi:GlcNAc-PI de-N-acetylase
MPLKQSFALLFAIVSAAYPQQSPYFSRNGVNSSAQILREIKNPAVYMVVAIAPGFEDRASIANFRIGNGANVAVAYVTNGEDIPSDLSGEMFYQLASRRKEEAYRALAYLGVQSYFLNIPVSEFSTGTNCFLPTAALNKILTARLDSVISQIKPDVIVLDRDPLSEGKESARFVYLKRLFVNNLRDKKKASLWNAKRFFVQFAESGTAAVVPVEQKDSVWSESYLEMARKAEGFYASLRYQIPLWKEHGRPRYLQAFPEKLKPPLPLSKDLPQIGGKLKTLLPAIYSINAIDTFVSRERRLALLRHAIAQVDSFIQIEARSMNPTDLRVLATWKLQLENLRCEILDIAIQYNVSDTIVTPIQVFFLKFGKLDSVLKNGKTQVVFPGVIQKQWIVNETQDNFYPLKDSAQFRVLSPRTISLNSTETPQGFGAMQVRTPLVFIVSHRDSDAARNFMFKEEIPLIIAPYRSAEVLSPQVMMYRDTNIRVRFRSNVRDKTKGIVYINDPVVSSPERKLDLPGKNYVETDTLPLLWRDTVLSAPHQVTISAGKGNSVGSFTVQPADVKVKIKNRAALCSAIENSPVQIALCRLGVATTSLNTTNSSVTEMADISVIIVDQFSFDKFLGLGMQLDSLEQWLKRGGRLIILPQHRTERTNPFLGKEISFADLSAGNCTEKMSIDSTDSVLYLPNRIDESRFTETPFAISYSEIAERESRDSKVLMKAGSRVLLLEKHLEYGRIFYCALNLFPRLLDIHLVSYELLANLISTGLEQ